MKTAIATVCLSGALDDKLEAIANAGYTGFVAQEFIPRKDPMASLRRAVEICDQ